MINVLSIIDTGGPGGAETVFLETATKLDSSRFNTTVVVSREGWLAEQLRAAGVEPLIQPAAGSFNFKYLVSLILLAKRKQIDVILAHLYGCAVYASLVGFLTRTPVVIVLHGQTDISGTSRLAAMKARIVRQCSRKVVFVSENLRRDLDAALHLPSEKVVVIPNGVDIERFFPRRDRRLRSQLGLDDSTTLVGAVGNIRTPKDYETLLHAAAIINRESSSRFHFVVCGEGGGTLFDRLLALRTELQLEANFTFLGLRSDIPTVMNNLDVFALTSTTEGFSIVCLEAMACGVPVVATRSGGPELIIESESSGLLVPVRNPRALADAIRRVAGRPLIACRLAEGGLERVRSCYSLPTMLAAYGDVLGSVHGERHVRH